MSETVFIGVAPGSGPWNHPGGGNISRAAGPFAPSGDAIYAGVAANATANATNSLTLPTPVDDMLLDQWLKVNLWSVSLVVPVPGTSIGDADGLPFTLDFDVATGRTATVAVSGGEGVVSFDSETPVDQSELLLGGVETRIEFADARIVNATNSETGTFQADTNREFTLVIKHGEWGWHGPLAKWCAGLTLGLEWSVLDYPEIPYDETSVTNQTDPPETTDNCPGGYHWNGAPGTNLGNESDPLYTYVCALDIYSKPESVTAFIDPDMERAGALGVSTDDYFQIGTFLGRAMWVRMNRVEGDEFWDVDSALLGANITISAAGYYGEE